ncbi:MutS-related protein [Caldalkalibacillus salinus]|uniref:MutS-related protein n=1 Tax=Caldalkalibacillus salinus TaxID=2803787 RepID=UPI001921E38E|nr:hypothetical protein [Caldalkalibacillus salinus]
MKMDQWTQEWIEFLWYWRRCQPLSHVGRMFQQTVYNAFSDHHTGSSHDDSKIEAWEYELFLTQCSVPYLPDHHDQRMVDALQGLRDITHFLALINKGSSGSVEDWYNFKQWLWDARTILDYITQIKPDSIAETERHLLIEAQAKQTLRNHLQDIRLANEKIKGWLQALGTEERAFQLDTLSMQLREEREHLLHLQQTLLQRRETFKESVLQTLSGGRSWHVNGDYVYIPSDHKEWCKQCDQHPSLQRVRETPFETVFQLLEADDIVNLQQQIAQIEADIQALEQAVLRRLANRLRPMTSTVETWIKWIAEWDWRWAKGRLYQQLSQETEVCWPVITQNKISIEQGTFLPLFQRLQREGGQTPYVPISLTLHKGLTTLTGSNMGGKSMALKTTASLITAAQYGLPVPAKQVQCPLFQRLTIIAGDHQTHEHGLSTFGAEITRLTDALSQGSDLLLLDELMKGTNPREGEALAYAVAEYLAQNKTCFSLLITHFSQVTAIETAVHYQVKSPTDKGKFSYTLTLRENDAPEDYAIRVAERLGLHRDIVSKAEAYLTKYLTKDTRKLK